MRPSLPALAAASALALCAAGSAEANRVFVTNERGNTVTVIDSDS